MTQKKEVIKRLNDFTDSGISDIPCIDPKSQEIYEQRQKLIGSILDLLKGKTYGEAQSILEQCTWDIKQKAII